MATPKFKDQLVENVATVVRIVERGNVSDSKYGGKTTWHKIGLNGQVFDHGASDAEMNALGLLNVGEDVQVVKRKNDYGTFSLYWSPKDGAEARMNANPQPMNNTAMHRQDKQLENYENEKMVHDYKLGLAGIVQAMIIQGADETKIKAEAPEWVQWIRKKSQEMALGIPSVPSKVELPGDVAEFYQD